MKIVLLMAIFAICCLSFQESNAARPGGGGLIPGWTQTPGMDGEIKGIRVNPGWGYHKTVWGLDIGIANTTSKEFIGIGMAAVFNSNLGRTIVTGVQLAGLMNRNAGNTDIAGLQIAVGINSAGKGKTSVYGAQLALGNLGANKIYGLQIGIYNEAEAIYGFQVGLINKTKELHGIQIGLANFVDKGAIPFMPIINIGF